MSNILKVAAAGAVSAPATDPNFNQTVLLLHGDGTDGAQNNTFLDSSTNNFTITRNGNTTQGTFSPFSVADGEWSNYFDGSGDYLSIAANSAFLYTGDFTIEMWVYPLVFPAVADFRFLFGTGGSGAQDQANIYSNGTFVYFDGTNSVTSPTLNLNAWNHIAVTRNGTTIRAYANGVSGTSQTKSGNLGSSANAFRIAERSDGLYDNNCWMSNLRVVNGTAVYTGSTYTVPTAPLTAVSGTSLLTCQSNRFVDNSSNAFAITVNGNTSVQPFSPFAPSAAYSPTTNGGSGYFDGSGDYLSVANNAALNVLGGSFTIECWFYLTEPQADAGLISKHSPGYILRLDTTFIRFYTSAATVDRTYSFAQNTWYHVAVVSNGTTGTLYVNGVAQGATFSTNGTNATTDLQIGRTNTVTNDFGGYITNVRITNTVVYSSDFTPPTSPPTAISGTVFLCNFTNAGIFDNTGKNNLETVGNAQIDTTTKKFGTGSMEFDGTGDWLKVPNSPNIQLGTGHFTIEFWVYLASGDTGSNRGLVAKGGASTGWLVSLNTTEKVVFTYTTSTITSSGAITTNAWNHIAVVREGTGSNETKIYIGGTNDGTGTVSTNFNQTEVMYIGANRASGDPMKGFIDDLRITKGVARYTTTFTPPTEALPDL